MTEIKTEIFQLWEEHFNIIEGSGSCDSPQKTRALSLMKKLLKDGHEKDKQWIFEEIIKIRWRVARIDQARGNLSGAEEQRKKAKYFLDTHPEIDPILKSWIEVDLKRIERRCQDGDRMYS